MRRGHGAGARCEKGVSIATQMKGKPTGLLADALRERASLAELLVVAVLLAFAINLLAGALPSLLGWPPWAIALLSILLGIGAVTLLVRRVYSQLAYRREFEGFFLYDIRENRVISVPRYEFADELSSYLRGAFAENPAFKSFWDEQPLNRGGQERGTDMPRVRPGQTYSAALIREAVEYFLIDRASIHIRSYFERGELEEERLQVFQRHDVPGVLLSNRFMELFTRSVDERMAFHSMREERPDVVLVAAHGEGGAIYSRFELVLPSGSIVARLPDNAIRITTKRLRLELRSVFDGFMTVLPTGFEDKYLGLKADDRLEWPEAYQVSIDVRISFRPLAIFTRSGWDYYQWVDSFLDNLEERFSGEAFFARINWETALTVSEVLAHTRQPTTLQQSSPEEQTGAVNTNPQSGATQETG
jgi:hypothetical protein